MNKFSLVAILILIIGGAASMGFVLSESQYHPSDDLDPTPHAPYAYENTYAVDMGLEEPFGIRVWVDVLIPYAYGHAQMVGSSPGEYIPHSHEVNDEKAKQNFITILIGTIVITMLITVLVVYREKIILFIKKD